MNIIKYIPKSVTSTVGRSMLKTQKASPQLLFAAGVTGMVTSTVLACRATLKLEPILDEAQGKLAEVNEAAKSPTRPSYGEEEAQHDKKIYIARAGIDIIKLYAPAVIIGGLSVVALTSSHRILNNRNAALSAAYAGLDKAFSEYRHRVRDKYGDEAERDLRYDSQEETFLNENSKGVIKEEKRKVAGPRGASMYAKFFRPGNINYCTTPEYNIMFLRGQQTYANQRLNAKGYLMLCDVYDALGLERTTASQVVGWIKDGTQKIDFGIFNSNNMDQVQDFMFNREGEILLDFNVDGEVYRLLDEIGVE